MGDRKWRQWTREWCKLIRRVRQEQGVAAIPVTITPPQSAARWRTDQFRNGSRSFPILGAQHAPPLLSAGSDGAASRLQGD